MAEFLLRNAASLHRELASATQSNVDEGVFAPLHHIPITNQTVHGSPQGKKHREEEKMFHHSRPLTAAERATLSARFPQLPEGAMAWEPEKEGPDFQALMTPPCGMTEAVFERAVRTLLGTSARTLLGAAARHAAGETAT